MQATARRLSVVSSTLHARRRLIRVFPPQKMKKILTLAAVVIFVMSSALTKDPGPLVLYWIGTVPVEMRDGDEYGVMLVNDGGGEENPTPRYIFAVATSRTVVETNDLDLFRTLVGRVPKGTTIFSYGSCSMPRSWGLKEEHFEAFDNVFKDLGLILSGDQRITCYCDSVAK